MKNKAKRKIKKFIAVSLVIVLSLSNGIIQQLSSVDFGSFITIKAQSASTEIAAGALIDIVIGYISVENNGKEVDISEYEIPWSSISTLIAQLKYTYPLVFSILSISHYYYYKGKASDGSYIISSIKLYSNEDVTKYESKLEELIEVTDSVLDATVGMSDFEKVVYVYDYIILNTSYDYTYSKYTAYEALVEGSAVCEGYAQAFYLLMSLMGINCVVVDSLLMYHVWNMVELDGKWYHLDATRDDSSYNGSDVTGRVEYTLFLLNDEEISNLNHYSWSSDYTSTSTTYSNMPRTSNNLQTYYDDLWYYYSNGSLYSCDQYGKNIKYISNITGDGIAIIEDVYEEKYIVYGSDNTMILQSISDPIYKSKIFYIGSVYRYYSFFISGSTVQYYYDNSTGYSTNDSDTTKAGTTQIQLSKYLVFDWWEISTKWTQMHEFFLECKNKCYDLLNFY